MFLDEYIKKEYPSFCDQILYSLNSNDCIVMGGFVKAILINEKWNNEIDVISYNYEKTYSEIINLFPPDSIEDKDSHRVLKYQNYKLDLCKPFPIHDYSFNCLGLTKDNIVLLPNIFIDDINLALYLIDHRMGLRNKQLAGPVTDERKIKFKDWKIIK